MDRVRPAMAGQRAFAAADIDVTINALLKVDTAEAVV